MKTVITMTSWSKRIQFTARAIYRFLKTQIVKPDLFYLWLAEEEFPNREADLPENLLTICEAFNVQIKWTKDNEYCFKRWYVFPEHNEDMVISIDDDMFYDPRTIAAVLEEYKRNPIPCVLHYSGCGGLVEIRDGIKYTPTQNLVRSSVRNYFMGQCAFTPNSFPLETLEPKTVELRKKICPKCDESFLHPYLIKNNIPIVFILGLRGIEDSEMQNVAIRNDLHLDLVKINGKEYKKADLYKLKVLQMIPELQESWKREFPNYNFEEFMRTHTDIINSFIKERNFTSYLEIGIHNKNDNFNKINCQKKVGVDPDVTADADFQITSDEFFKNNTEHFDIVFIDGMHEAHQVYKDIKNSLKVLNKGGIIVCHDCNPESLKAAGDWEEFSKDEYGSYCWNGDSWKGFVKYRFESEFFCYVLNTDCGCGIIDTNRPSTVEKKEFHIGEMVYADLDNNRKGLLGLV